jgi:outer membrane receptor for ferrienterochelin and colicin
MIRSIPPVRILIAAAALILLGLPLHLRAQECSDVTLEEAMAGYTAGKFSEVISQLHTCIGKGFNEKQKVQAYRILAMTYIAIDSIQSAAQEVSYLLQINPDFEVPLLDPLSFKVMVNEMKMSGGGQLVTSVSKKAENIDQAPATIQVITRTEIQQRGYNDLVELLKDVPGFDLSMFYGSEYANIYQRGFRQNNTEKTLLLIDGIEENDLWTNWAYLDRQYPLSNIERVEIIYGPASTMYGPNAFAGVINVITRNPVESVKQGHALGVDVQGKYGTYNTKSVDMTISGHKRNISFAVTGRMFWSDEADLSSQKFFDYDKGAYDTVNYSRIMDMKSGAGAYLISHNLPFTHPYYVVSADSSKLALTPLGIETAKNLDKSALDQEVNGNPVGFTNQSKEWFLNGRLRIGNFSFGFQTWKYSRGSTTQYTDLYVPGSKNGFNWVPQLSYFFAKYESQLSDKLFFSNLTTYRIHILTQNSRFVSLSNYARGNRSIADLVSNVNPSWMTQYAYENSSQLRSEFKLIWTPVSTFDLVSGVEVRYSSLQGAYLMSPYDTPMDSAVINPSPKGGNQFSVWDLGAYTQGTYSPWKKWKFTLGLRYDFNRVRDHGGFGNALSPRVAVVWFPGKFTFKAIYSHGIMNVSNWTKYSSAGNRIPNPNLKTENIDNIELSAGFRLNKNFHADIDIYRDYINNVVGTVPADAAGKVMNGNIGKFRITGIMATANYQYESWSAFFNYTFCDPRQVYSEKGDVDNRVGDISQNQFNLGVDKMFWKQLNINLRMNFTGVRKVGEGTTVPLNTQTFPAIAILNAAVTYSNSHLVPGLSVQLVCNNILNTDYYHPGTKAADGINSPTGILQRGRHFLFSLSYSY